MKRKVEKLPKAEKAAEAGLVARAKNGDGDAFNALFEPMRPRLLKYTEQKVSGAGADDIVNEALVKAWNKLSSFSGEASLYTWMCQVIKNTCLDHMRKTERRRETSMEIESDGSDDTRQRDIVDDKTRPPDIDTLLNEVKGYLSRAMSKMDETHRRPIEMYYYENLEYTEIAKKLNVPIGTVMSRISNAKKKLAKLIGSYYDAK